MIFQFLFVLGTKRQIIGKIGCDLCALLHYSRALCPIKCKLRSSPACLPACLSGSCPLSVFPFVFPLDLRTSALTPPHSSPPKLYTSFSLFDCFQSACFRTRANWAQLMHIPHADCAPVSPHSHTHTHKLVVVLVVDVASSSPVSPQLGNMRAFAAFFTLSFAYRSTITFTIIFFCM